MKAIQLTAYGNPAQNLKLVERNNDAKTMKRSESTVELDTGPLAQRLRQNLLPQVQA